MTKKDYKKNPQPQYYTGKIYGYSAKDIVDDFDLSSWTSQAVQYILRAGKKKVVLLNKIYRKQLMSYTLN